MSNITDIYRLDFIRDRFQYNGLLRNEKVFGIGETVFFSINGGDDISYGIIKGIELTDNENPEFIYKIRFSRDLIGFVDDTNLHEVTIICDKIFRSIDEAKESALKNLERMHRLQLNQINSYFDKLKETYKLTENCPTLTEKTTQKD